MRSVHEQDQQPQGPADETPARQQVAILRRAMTRAAVVIAALLTDHPTAADARTAARAWLLSWNEFQILAKIEQTTAELAVLAGGSR